MFLQCVARPDPSATQDRHHLLSALSVHYVDVFRFPHRPTLFFFLSMYDPFRYRHALLVILYYVALRHTVSGLRGNGPFFCLIM
jgi:hypothetical protein